MVSAEPAAGIVSFTYNADGQRIVEEASDGVTGYLYHLKRILHETDDVGDITTTYASGTDDEYGDLIGEDGQYGHQYDAQED